MNKSEQLFEITKYLHTPRKKRQIKEKFKLSDSTLSHLFTDGEVKFLNVRFPLFRRKLSREDRFVSDSETYELLQNRDQDLRSTVHPIILPLNLTEVFALTYHLLDITKNTDDYLLYKEIASQIYSQLSDYAKSKLGNNEHHIDVQNLVKFKSEQDMFSEIHSSMFMYILKCGGKVRCKLGEDKYITGSVEMKDSDYYIKTDDESYKYNDIADDVVWLEKVAN